jgi:hypothetical protein
MSTRALNINACTIFFSTKKKQAKYLIENGKDIVKYLIEKGVV